MLQLDDEEMPLLCTMLSDEALLHVSRDGRCCVLLLGLERSDKEDLFFWCWFLFRDTLLPLLTVVEEPAETGRLLERVR